MSGPYFQRVQLIGMTGDQPEFKILPNNPFSRFNVAVDEWYKNRETGKNTKITTWFRCSAFGKTAEHAKNIIEPGKMIFIEGRLRVRRTEDREFWSITVDTFRMLDKRERNLTQETEE